VVFFGTAIWILAEKGWAAVDPTDPRKVLALEVAATVRAHAPWSSQNGDAPKNWSQRIWNRLRSERVPTDGPSAS